MFVLHLGSISFHTRAWKDQLDIYTTFCILLTFEFILLRKQRESLNEQTTQLDRVQYADDEIRYSSG